MTPKPMRFFATMLFLTCTLLCVPGMEAQPLTNRWNPTGGAGTEAASQYRAVGVNPVSGRLYVTSSGTPTGVLYWDRTDWDKPTSPIRTPTGTFAPTKPDGTAWGAASPYGLTVDTDGNVYVYAFSDKKIYAYTPGGAFLFKVSTNGGAADLVTTQQARFLHSTGSFFAGTLSFYLVGATSPGNVYRIVQVGGPAVNTFTETLLFAEQNDGATNYAATATSDGNVVYVSSSAAGTTGARGLRRYLYNGSWIPDPSWPVITETVHDINLTSDNRALAVSIPGNRALRIYDAERGIATGGANYGVSGAAMASGGVATFGRRTAFAVGHVSATRSFLEVFDAAQPLSAGEGEGEGAGTGLAVEVRGRTVRFSVGENQHVRAEAFNVLGQRVGVLYDGEAAADAVYTMDAPDAFAPGLYLVRVSGHRAAATASLVVVR